MVSLCSETDFEATRKILKSVRKALAGSPFMFKDDYARIISGEEEGISSWITLNYLKKALDLSVVCDMKFLWLKTILMT